MQALSQLSYRPVINKIAEERSKRPSTFLFLILQNEARSIKVYLPYSLLSTDRYNNLL